MRTGTLPISMTNADDPTLADEIDYLTRLGARSSTLPTALNVSRNAWADRPSHGYRYGASKPSLRPAV